MPIFLVKCHGNVTAIWYAIHQELGEAGIAARPYESYLLRVWESDHAGELIWRALLESTDTGERHGFADLSGLFAYLDTVCQTLPPDDAHNI